METYELRLYDARGNVTLTYAVNCTSDQQARTNLHLFQRETYSDFEIWHGDVLIASGPHLTVAA